MGQTLEALYYATEIKYTVDSRLSCKMGYLQNKRGGNEKKERKDKVDPTKDQTHDLLIMTVIYQLQ